MWRKGKPSTLGGAVTGAAIVANSMEIKKKIKHRTTMCMLSRAQL